MRASIRPVGPNDRSRQSLAARSLAREILHFVQDDGQAVSEMANSASMVVRHRFRMTFPMFRTYLEDAALGAPQQDNTY